SGKRTDIDRASAQSARDSSESIMSQEPLTSKDKEAIVDPLVILREQEIRRRRQEKKDKQLLEMSRKQAKQHHHQPGQLKLDSSSSSLPPLHPAALSSFMTEDDEDSQDLSSSSVDSIFSAYSSETESTPTGSSSSRDTGDTSTSDEPEESPLSSLSSSSILPPLIAKYKDHIYNQLGRVKWYIRVLRVIYEAQDSICLSSPDITHKQISTAAAVIGIMSAGMAIGGIETGVTAESVTISEAQRSGGAALAAMPYRSQAISMFSHTSTSVGADAPSALAPITGIHSLLAHERGTNVAARSKSNELIGLDVCSLCYGINVEKFKNLIVTDHSSQKLSFEYDFAASVPTPPQSMLPPIAGDTSLPSILWVSPIRERWSCSATFKEIRGDRSSQSRPEHSYSSEDEFDFKLAAQTLPLSSHESMGAGSGGGLFSSSVSRRRSGSNMAGTADERHPRRRSSVSSSSSLSGSSVSGSTGSLSIPGSNLGLFKAMGVEDPFSTAVQPSKAALTVTQYRKIERKLRSRPMELFKKKMHQFLGYREGHTFIAGEVTTIVPRRWRLTIHSHLKKHGERLVKLYSALKGYDVQAVFPPMRFLENTRAQVIFVCPPEVTHEIGEVREFCWDELVRHPYRAPILSLLMSLDAVYPVSCPRVSLVVVFESDAVAGGRDVTYRVVTHTGYTVTVLIRMPELEIQGIRTSLRSGETCVGKGLKVRVLDMLPDYGVLQEDILIVEKIVEESGMIFIHSRTEKAA
ncbi:hypothetical protein ADUPG1_008401, partial [Aduncisulcus paluster]